jgi:3-deoxy-D-manno-octulosonic-acid transferase
LAAEPLIHRLIEELPGFRVVVSTTTLAGQTLAKDRTAKWNSHSDIPGSRQPRSNRQADLKAGFAGVFYFPFDWRFAVKRTLDRIHPAAIVIMETEIWPNFLDECRSRGIATILANGRVSERSFSRYRLARDFMERVLGSVTMLLMQTEPDQERVVLLGANRNRVMVCGNLKYDAAVPHPAIAATPGLGIAKQTTPASEDQAIEIARLLRLDAAQPLIVAGSTAAGEEQTLVAAFAKVIRSPGLQSTRMILAPRRPERFDEVAKIVAERSAELDVSWVRRSQVRAGPADHCEEPHSRLILLDSIGELAGVYRFASVVFVGGSLVPHGGHNIIEPAAFAKPILVGPYTDNFTQVVNDFAGAGALVQIKERDHTTQVEALATEWVRLLTDPGCAKALGARAHKILESNRGATARTITAIRAAVQQAPL